MLIALTVNQLLFATTLFQEFLEIHVNWFATTISASKSYTDPCCFDNHMTRTVRGDKYLR